MKTAYAGLVAGRPDIELAETFFNSASRRIFHTVGVDPVRRVRRVRGSFALSPIRAGPRETYSGAQGTAAALWRILAAPPFPSGWEDLARDAGSRQRSWTPT